MQTCRVCGCSEFAPCISSEGETCSWTEADLCDFCAIDAQVQGSDQLVELFSEGDLNQLIARRRAAGA